MRILNTFMKNLKKICLFFVFTTLVLVSSFTGYQTVQAVGGQGTATIDGAANVTVDQATSHKFTVVLTIGTSGITADAQNPTFTIPAGFTAPDATPVANAGLVVADGDWSVSAAGGICTVENPTAGLTVAVGQLITVDVTTTCTVAVPDTITLTYQGQSASAMAATALVIATADDIGWGAVTPIAAPPTITVIATDVTAPTVTVTMDDAALNIGDTSLVTFTFSETPVGFTTADVTVANGSIGAIDASNPLVQTATYTPTNSITDATNVISVGTAWTDAALNTGVGDDSPNYTIDTTTSASSGGGGQFISLVPPLIDVVKIPNPLSLPAGGGPVTYTYTLSNIGTVPVTNITMVGDTCNPIALASGDNNNNAILDVNEIWTHRCSTTLSATHTNIVTTTGWANGISAVDIANATVVVGLPVVPPLIHVVKKPNIFVLPAPGGTVTYTYTVTNPGTVPLSNVNITDNKCTGLPGRVLGHPGDLNKNNLLENNETWSFTCQTNLTQTTTNTGTATGDANNLTATDFALATVVVNTSTVVPSLPKTGFPPKEENIPIVVFLSIFMFSSLLCIVWKQQNV